MSNVTGYIVKNPRPIFRRNLHLAPAHPLDDRVLVRENKPESVTESGLALPDNAVERCMNGVLIAVGDAAADYLYDRGIELGDVVLYAKYAGTVDQWQHVVGPDDKKCDHSGAWDTIPPTSATLDAIRGGADKESMIRARKWHCAGGPNENVTLKECRACATLIATERHIIMSCKDVLASVDLQERLETGVMTRYRGEANGAPRFYIRRNAPRPDCYGSVEPSELTSVKGAA